MYFSKFKPDSYHIRIISNTLSTLIWKKKLRSKNICELLHDNFNVILPLDGVQIKPWFYLRYSLVDDGEGRFTIDSNSGMVTTTTTLDRELEDSYQLVVMAADDGLLSRSAVVTLDVHVDDLNDNAPRFLQREYNVFIREPTNQGMLQFINFFQNWELKGCSS